MQRRYRVQRIALIYLGITAISFGISNPVIVQRTTAELATIVGVPDRFELIIAQDRVQAILRTGLAIGAPYRRVVYMIKNERPAYRRACGGSSPEKRHGIPGRRYTSVYSPILLLADVFAHE